VEREDEERRLVLSVRAKVSIIAVCYFLVMGAVAYLAAPQVVNALQAMGQGAPGDENKTEPPGPGGELRTRALILSARRIGDKSRLALHLYFEDNATLIWWAEMPGKIDAVSFFDINRDSDPEIVVLGGFTTTSMGQAARGCASLLIYQNTSVGYSLVLNESIPPKQLEIEPGMYGWFGVTSFSRARSIDYWDDGTEQMIITFNGTLVLVEEGPTGPVIVGYGAAVGSYGFDVGDVNHDGRKDIVFRSRRGFRVMENQGAGSYDTVTVESESAKVPRPIDEIRIGDVDGDGLNEIAMVGLGDSDPNNTYPAFAVIKYVDGEYRSIFSAGTGPIQAVDIGDVDGDGRDEIVTGGEGALPGYGLSVWDHDDAKGTFVQTWESSDARCQAHWMLTLRASVIDDSQTKKILARGDDLCIIEHDSGQYESHRIALPGIGQGNGLDVWPLQTAVDEIFTAGLTLVLAILYTMGRDTQQENSQSQECS